MSEVLGPEKLCNPFPNAGCRSAAYAADLVRFSEGATGCGSQISAGPQCRGPCPTLGGIGLKSMGDF